MNKLSTGAAPRREEILKLVREAPVRSQEDLLRSLRQRGFKVTQPTLSRDVRELGLAKTPAGYVLPSDLTLGPAGGAPMSPPGTRDERLHRAFRDQVASVEATGSLVILKTPPAAAQPVARAIDHAALDDVAGTIAGDDTVFVAARGAVAARRLADRFLASVRAARPLRRERA